MQRGRTYNSPSRDVRVRTPPIVRNWSQVLVAGLKLRRACYGVTGKHKFAQSRRLLTSNADCDIARGTYDWLVSPESSSVILGQRASGVPEHGSVQSQRFLVRARGE